jgi:hypothetical protein
MKNKADEVREILNALHDNEDMTWREIGDNIGLSSATVNDMAIKGREPRDAQQRARMGLPALEEVPVCEFCGVVHTRPCNKRRKRHHDSYKDLFATPVEVLRRDLENRKEF